MEIFGRRVLGLKEFQPSVIVRNRHTRAKASAPRPPITAPPTIGSAPSGPITQPAIAPATAPTVVATSATTTSAGMFRIVARKQGGRCRHLQDGHLGVLKCG